MRTDPTDPDGARLRDVLQAWKVPASLPPSFPDSVWRRIAREEAPPQSVWAALKGSVFARWRSFLVQPAGAAAYLMVLFAIGSGLGYWRSETYTAKAERAWRTAYVQSVNPSAISLEP